MNQSLGLVYKVPVVANAIQNQVGKWFFCIILRGSCHWFGSLSSGTLVCLKCISPTGAILVLDTVKGLLAPVY